MEGGGEDESSLYNILSKLALHPSPHCQFLVVLCEASIMMNDLYVFKNGDCKTFNLPRILKNCLMDCLDILVKNEVRRLYTEKELCILFSRQYLQNIHFEKKNLIVANALLQHVLLSL